MGASPSERLAPAAPYAVNRLLIDERLEVMRVTADQDVSWESDVINGPQRLGGGDEPHPPDYVVRVFLGGVRLRKVAPTDK